jgi:hypothetical protein
MTRLPSRICPVAACQRDARIGCVPDGDACVNGSAAVNLAAALWLIALDLPSDMQAGTSDARTAVLVILPTPETVTLGNGVPVTVPSGYYLACEDAGISLNWAIRYSTEAEAINAFRTFTQHNS